MKKLFILILVLFLVACNNSSNQSSKKVYKVGICNYVDDASLNQIYENIADTLTKLEIDEISFDVRYDNANADNNVMNQIVNNFIFDEVDLMVGIATPVAMMMQGLTEDNQIPVIFSAVSDPLGAKLVDSNEIPGHNISGTSDYLNTDAIIDIMFAVNENIKKVGLLYDASQDASKGAIAKAKELLNKKGVEVIEKTGTNVDEVRLASQALINEKVEAIFTPTDNTIMTAELSIYEDLSNAGIMHFAGADSFALNGAFLGYGVDYANLGKETANMIYDVLVNGKDIAKLPVKTFDNGIATINEDVVKALGLDFNTISKLIEPYCTSVKAIKTAESF